MNVPPDALEEILEVLEGVWELVIDGLCLSFDAIFQFYLLSPMTVLE